MALRIISALSSMRLSSQRLVAPSDTLRTSERLSSGQRITERPSDVAIISALKRDTRLATVALTNASTGVSLVSVADKALSEISTLLGKMYDLADAGSKTSFLSTT
jgi:flagellin